MLRPPLLTVSVVAAVLLGYSVRGFANDSTVTLGAGGLTFTKNAHVALLSEKLFLSPTLVTVDYEMQNTGEEAVETTVAFPLPRLNGPELVNEPVITDREHPDNFVNFTVSIDGQTVAAEKEVKAYAVERKGAEVTALLRDTGVLVPPVAKDFYETLEKLPAPARQKLVAAKLLEVDRAGSDETLTPLWEIQITYFWRQRFEPGKIVRVHHQYTPVVGHGFFSAYSFADERKPWCIDAGTERRMHELLEKQPKREDAEPLLSRKQVDYVLTTGVNWAGPIRAFELTIEKENPDQVVTLCFDGLQKVSPTRFQVAKKDFVPRKDLSVVFVEPLPPAGQ
jgi:hypothetical protein